MLPQKEKLIEALIPKIRDTWRDGNIKLDIGYPANVIDMGGIGLAIACDGVGTKTEIAKMMGKYDTIGIDCVAMCVNDLLCVGAKPIAFVDYLTLEDDGVVPEVMEGILEGCEEAGVALVGGETAFTGKFDLAGMAIGLVDLDKIITGRDIEEGDVLIGIESNGLHANGYTLARKILFQERELNPHERFTRHRNVGSIGEELLSPTHIYVEETLRLLEQYTPKAIIPITGYGLTNLSRVDSPVGFDIQQLPTQPEILNLIRKEGQLSEVEMLNHFNMGIGMAVVVSPDRAKLSEIMLSSYRECYLKAQVIGHAVRDKERRVSIPYKGLVSNENRFVEF